MSVITHFIRPHNMKERILEEQVYSSLDLMTSHDDALKLVNVTRITVWLRHGPERRNFVHLEVSPSQCCICSRYKRMNNSKLCVSCKSQKQVQYDFLFVDKIPDFYKRWMPKTIVQAENNRKQKTGNKILEKIIDSIGEDSMTLVLSFLFHVEDEPMERQNLHAYDRALARQYRKMTKCKKHRVPEFNFCPGHNPRDTLCYQIIDAQGMPSRAIAQPTEDEEEED